jgi:plastocyanin
MPPVRSARPARRRAVVAIVLAALAAVLLAATTASADSHDIAIRDTGFDPAILSVVAGEPVTWTNESAGEHTVTSNDGTLDSGPLGPGESYGHVFEAPGTFEYHDAADPSRTGTIVVEAAPVTPVPSGSPEATPPEGTLPPNFSPFPSTGPLPTPTPSPTPVPAATTAAAPSPTPAPGSAGVLEGLLGTAVPVIVIGGITGGLFLIFARRRRTDPAPGKPVDPKGTGTGTGTPRKKRRK